MGTLAVPRSRARAPTFTFDSPVVKASSSEAHSGHDDDPLVLLDSDREVLEVPGRLAYKSRTETWSETVNRVVKNVLAVHWDANADKVLTGYPLVTHSSYHVGQIKPSQTSKNGHLRVFEVPCSVAGRSENGLADAAAKMNFMKDSIAESTHGVIIDREKTDAVRLGSGKLTRTTGTAYASFKFKGETSVHRLAFGLLPTCMHNIILGMPFLKASKTLSDVSNRLRRIVERTRRMLTPKQYEFLYLGNGGGPKFEGFINDEPCEGLGDTGAKVGVLTESEAWFQELSISREEEDKCTLVMGDGSTVRTTGTAYNVPWRFGRGDEKSESYTIDFHIVKEAPHHIILPESLLYDSNAFCEYEEYLIDENAVDAEDEAHQFLMIDVAMEEQILAGRSFEDIRHDELVRQGQEEDRIDSLLVTERAVAWQQELRFRALWKASFEKQKSWHEANTLGAATVQIPAILSHGAQPTTSTTSGRRSLWLLVRKRKPQTYAHSSTSAGLLRSNLAALSSSVT